jgi:hypothetical protein
MATMLHLALPGERERATPGATPQQVADYHYQMLVADGVIKSAPFSFNPSSFSDYFYGRVPRHCDPFASASPFPEEAFAQPLDRGWPLDFADGLGAAIYEGDSPASRVFGPRRAAAPRAEDEDELIAQNISEAQRKLIDSLAGSADDGEDFIQEAQRGEEFIQEQAQLMREAQRLRGFAPPPTQPYTELQAVLALSAQLAADTDSAALEEGLTLSKAFVYTAATPANTDESAEAGVDIPFTTPSTLVDDTSSSSAPSAAAGTKGESSQSGAAATSKQGSRGKGKRSKGKGAQV